MATEPSRSELIELYKIAIDEYRFQVNLNWNRSQYYLALNIAITGLATGLLQSSHTTHYLIAGIYFAGLVCCVLSVAAAAVQQGYYRATRNHKRQVEERLQLGDLAIQTTPGMGSTVRRIGKVTTFISIILTVLGATDLGGAIYSLTR